MRTASFQNNYEKVFRRSKAIIKRKKYNIVSEDFEQGILKAKRPGSIFQPTYFMEVNVKKIDDTSTNVCVSVKPNKHWYKIPELKTIAMEGRFIAMLS